MKKFSEIVVKFQKSIIILFLVLSVIGGLLFTTIRVNYNMVDYLPKDAQSTQAIRLMETEFDQKNPNARVMVEQVSIVEALNIKKQLENISEINQVMWLDDVIGEELLLATPLAFFDDLIVEQFYHNEKALFSISIIDGKEIPARNAILELIKENDAVAGEAINAATTQEMAVSEVLNAMFLLLPIIIVILILTSTSWLEPLLYLITIGVAVIINMGTSAFWSEISFITQTVAPILQLAVSLDYAIFLLHTYNEYKIKDEPALAMKKALQKAVPTVAASAATTVIGFMALLFMRFEIGLDLGIHLAKGVAFSFLAVMVFLPALVLKMNTLLEKSTHRPFITSFKRTSKAILKVKYFFLIFAIIIVTPAFLAQSKTEFMYGMGEIAASGRVGQDTIKIENEFGKENPLVLLVKTKEPGIELTLSQKLSEIKEISSVVSYATMVGTEIPSQYVPEAALKQFYSQDYTRLILYTDLPEEGEKSFAVVSEVMELTEQFYEDYYITGQSSVLYDMKSIVEADTTIINLIAVLGIFIVLLINFKSFLLPLLLVFTIETAIWINLSVAYFTNNTLSFIGYLIISTVQLGATVDYAILFTNNYLYERKSMDKAKALSKTLNQSLVPLLTSAGILTTAGIALSLTSNNPIIAELGTLLARGTVLSFLMVIIVLPAAIKIFDRFIFLKKKERSNI